jgi:hypothetical protein
MILLVKVITGLFKITQRESYGTVNDKDLLVSLRFCGDLDFWEWKHNLNY